MEDILKMSGKEWRYLVEMELIRQGKETKVEAAQRLEISYRQCQRLYDRYRQEGMRGFVHRSRGRPSNRRTPEGVREEIVELYRHDYEGFGPTLACEKLLERGYRVDHETLRRWLTSAGLWERQRKRGEHRRWRERKEHFGELVQMDGSFHDWFGTGQQECLMNMVDDATGTTLGLMFEQETTEAALRTLKAWIERYGVPQALYTDRKNVYITEREPTIEEQLEGKQPLTAFGRACQKLNIRIIAAHSPQAKGRVERSNGVYQDRLVKECHLQGITTMRDANRLLRESFCDGLNAKFACKAASDVDFHRPVPSDLDLNEVFVWEEPRRVSNDSTVRYEQHVWLITGPRRHLPPAKAQVVMQRRLDGSLHVFYRGFELTVKPVVLSPKKTQESQRPLPLEMPQPSADHPWRRSYKEPQRQRIL